MPYQFTRSPRLASFAAAFLALTILACPGVSSAHLLPARFATIHLVKDAAFSVVSVPASAFKGVDDDHDGRLSISELSRHNNEMTEQFRRGVVIESGKTPSTALFTSLMIPDPAVATSDYVVVLQVNRFPAPPQQVRIRYHLFGSGPGEDAIKVKATDDQRVDVFFLTKTASSHRLFPGPLASLLGYTLIGVSHILLGLDHLLFILTVMISGVGWRYWATTLTGFTLAHSVTLGLTILNVISVPSRIVEPAIAASIVLIAAVSLFRGEMLAKYGVIVVGACGLLHGLGFASALSGIGLDPSHKLVDLAGFNIGVEIGQVAFLAAALGVGRLLVHVAPVIGTAQWRRLVALVAIVLGAALFAARLAITP